MPASEKAIPEELLREILSYSLRVHPHEFLSFRQDCEAIYVVPTSKPTTKETEQLPASRLMLVSKRWLRVGTPLLYESVRVSTPAHLSTLRTLLSSNPEVGRAVRNLRLQRVYNAELEPTLGHMPNLRALYLYVGVPSSCSNLGLLRVLPKLQLRKLYVDWQGWSPRTRMRFRPGVNVKTTAIQRAVAEVIKYCSTLELVAFTYGLNHSEPIVDALCTPSSVKELSIFMSDAEMAHQNGKLQKILTVSNIERILCREPNKSRIVVLQRLGSKGGAGRPVPLLPTSHA